MPSSSTPPQTNSAFCFSAGFALAMKASLVAKDGKAYLQMKTGYLVEMNTIRPEEIKDQPVSVSIRPEEMIVNTDGKGVKAVIDDSVFLGINTTYFVHFDDGEKAIIIQESKIDSILPKGTEVHLGIKTEKINVFDESGNKNLVAGVVNDMDALRGGKAA